VFFLWYGQRHGPGALPGLITSMASSAGRAAQFDALKNAVPTDQSVKFTEDYQSGPSTR
jgi:hypothetical protein